jgi:DNA-directed RNA polymerase specialized sigma24 family protein
MDGSGQEPKGRRAKDPEKGPPRPFDEVYPAIIRIVRKVVGDTVSNATKLDWAHDIGLRMWQLYGDADGVFRPPVNTLGYIGRSARNRLADFLAARRLRPPRDREYEEARGASVREWMDPDHSVRTLHVDEDYARALNSLDDEIRAIYLRVREDEVTQDAVARERGVTVRHVKYHVGLARDALRVLGTRYGPTDGRTF